MQMSENAYSNPKMARAGVLSAFLMLAICLGLGAATLVGMLNGPDGLRAERIARTPALPVTASAIKRFPGDARHYLARRYAGKDTFKRWNARLLMGVFGHASAPQITTGRADALFLDNAEAWASSLGVPFRPEEAAAWTEVFRSIGEEFPSRSPRFIAVLPPNRHSILSDELPEWAPAPPRDRRLTAAVAMAGRHMTEPPVDLFSLYSETILADPQTPIYHRTDSHWTEYGAALALEAALGPPPLPLIWEMRETTGGDLTRLLGRTGDYREVMPVLAGPGTLECRDPKGQSVDPVIFDPLPFRQLTCQALGAGGTGRALIFSDSYGVSAVPALARHFAQVTLVRDLSIDPALIQAIDPDVVGLIMVERALVRLSDPTQLVDKLQ